MGTFPTFPIPESPAGTTSLQGIYHSGLHNAANAPLYNEAQRLLSTCDLTGTTAVDSIFDSIYALVATSSGFGSLNLQVPAGIFRFTRPSYQSQTAIRFVGQGVDKTIFKADMAVGYATISTATHSGTTVTVTTTGAHGFTTGDRITLAEIFEYTTRGYSPNGTNQRLPSTYYNGAFTITVTGPTTFTYTAHTTPGVDADPGTGICGYSMFVIQAARRPTFENIFFQGSVAKKPVDLLYLDSVGTVNNVVQSEKLTLINCQFGGDKFIAPTTYNLGDTTRNGVRCGGKDAGSDKLFLERLAFESLYSGITLDQTQSVWSHGINISSNHCSYVIRTASNLHVYGISNNATAIAEIQVNGAAQVDVRDWDSEECAALYFDIPHIQGGLSIGGRGQWLLPTVASGLRTGAYIGSMALCRSELKLEGQWVNYIARTGADRPPILVQGAPSAISVQASLAGGVTILNTSGLTYTDLSITSGTDSAGLRILLASDGMFTRTHLINGAALPATQTVDLEAGLGLGEVSVSSTFTTPGVLKTVATFPTGDAVVLATEPTYIPSDLSGLALWLKADAGYYKDAGVTLAANGDTIQQWNDQAAGVHHTSQATAANRPTYVSSWTNSLPALSFDGTNDSLATATQALTGATAMTIFAVFDRDHTDTAAIRMLADINGTGVNGLTLATNAAAIDEVYFGVGDGAAVDVNAKTLAPGDGPMVVMGLFTNGAAASLWLNGTVQGASTTTALGGVAQAKDYIGSNAGASRYFKGKLGELITYNRQLSTAEQAKITHYLGRRYAVTVA